MEQKLDFNGVPIRERKPQNLDARYLIQLKVTFNPETGETEPDESDTIDLVAMIQTYKDQCGMEGALRMLKTGQVTAEALADDGKHGIDATKLPANAQEVANALLRSTEFKDQFAEKFGIPKGAENLTDDQLSNLIGKKVEEILGNYIKKQEVKDNA